MAKKRVRNHTNPLNFNQRMHDVGFPADLTQYTDVDLEIGFGRGKFISAYAHRYPNRLVVAVEVRKRMVELFHSKHSYPNLLALWGTGEICLEDVIPNQSLSRVFIFHPDPWFKKRHFKRRVVSEGLLNLLRKREWYYLHINRC